MTMTTAEKENAKVNEAEFQKTEKSRTDAEKAGTSTPNAIEPNFAKEHKSPQKTEKVKEDSHAAKDKEREKAKRAPIESVAQLRDEAAATGKNTTSEQIDEAREVETKIAEDGAKETRLSSAVADKPKG